MLEKAVQCEKDARELESQGDYHGAKAFRQQAESYVDDGIVIEAQGVN